MPSPTNSAELPGRRRGLETVAGKALGRILTGCLRYLRPGGIMVAVIGPDGSGKGALIEATRRRLLETLQIPMQTYHWRPWLLPSLRSILTGAREEHTYVTNPHPRKPSDPVGSVLRVAYYAADYVLGYWLLVRPRLGRNCRVAVFERYYYDYFFDPERTIAAPPRWAVELFGAIIPRPDLVVFVAAPAETIEKRKPELSLAEIRRQMHAMRAVAARFQNAVWIDTSKPIEESTQEMVHAVVQALRRRQC